MGEVVIIDYGILAVCGDLDIAIQSSAVDRGIGDMEHIASEECQRG